MRAASARHTYYGPPSSPRNTYDLEIDLPSLFVAVAEAAEVRKSAVALLIDELQYFTTKELGALITAMHCLQQMAPSSGQVAIGTMHLAKGLEFRAVAVMASDEDDLEPT